MFMSTHTGISEICLILFYEAFTKRLSWDRQCLDAHIDIECCACSSASGFICTNERIYIRRRMYICTTWALDESTQGAAVEATSFYY